MLKEKGKRVIHKILKQGWGWELSSLILRFANRVEIEKKALLPNKIAQGKRNLERVFSDLKIRRGPFAGMAYPEFISFGSWLFPKLIGCYESELHGLLMELRKNTYSEILIIGCAEGYYAVGMALNYPESLVYCFDIDREALKFCRRMAEINGVGDRIILRSKCSEKDLEEFPFRRNALVFCDCEGCEKEIFSKNSAKNLMNCDLVIESHDFVDPTISQTILEVFSSSHDAKLIKVRARDPKQYPELKQLSRFERRYALNEGRPSGQEWVFLNPKPFVPLGQ